MANVNVQRSNWMLGVVDSTPLYQMSIPGTHETCALHGGGPTQCQWHSVSELLDRGVRFLDIRCVHAVGSLGSKEFPIYHNTIYQETNFQDVQTECTNFLSNHPSECIRAAGAYVGSAAEATNKTILQYLRTEHTDPSKRLGVLPIDFVGNTDQEAERLEDVIIRRNPFKPGYQFV